MTSLNIASLAGIGKIEDPEPKDYLAAIRHLPEYYQDSRGHWIGIPESGLRGRLLNTYRRLEWTPKRLRAMK